MEVLITANSPGEIAGWTRPVVKCLREVSRDIKISVLLLPCSFSSGREREVAESIPGVYRVYGVKETLSMILAGEKGRFAKPRHLLHLGGDLFYAALLSRRFRMPAWAFEWAQKQWDQCFQGYFARDEKNRQILLNRKISPEKIHVVGDLLVDSVFFRAEEAEKIDKGGNMLIGLMPGSRLREALGLLPLFAAVAELIEEKFPGTIFYLPISPFIDREKLDKAFPLDPDEKFEGVRIHKDKDRLVTEKGLEIHLDNNSMKVIKNSDFIITIPGTTTGEAGTLGIPHLSILPLNRPELVPYIGIIGLLEHVPLIGKPLKRKLMLGLAAKRPLLSQPNLRAGKELIPEIMEVVNPDNLFRRLLPFLEDKNRRDSIGRELTKLYAPLRGAAEKIAEVVGNEAVD